MKKCTNFEEKKDIFGERLYWHYCLQLSFVYKPCLRFLLNCFVRKIKDFYQRSFGNEVDFRNIISVSVNILAKKEQWLKQHQCLSVTGKPFCLRKKRSENALLILTVNYGSKSLLGILEIGTFIKLVMHIFNNNNLNIIEINLFSFYLHVSFFFLFFFLKKTFLGLKKSKLFTFFLWLIPVDFKLRKDL